MDAALATLACVLDGVFTCLGPLFVLAAVVLTSMVSWVTWHDVIIQLAWPHNGLHSLVAIWLLFNIFFNFLSCTFTHPGSTKKVPIQELQASMMCHRWRYCVHCDRPKPPLAHHCHICKQCVFRMDHHCPWVNNCVGHYNYRFFLLFLLWLWLGTCYAVWLLFPRVGPLLFPHWFPTAAPLLRRAFPGALYGFTRTLSLMLAIAVALALLVLLAFHAFLVLTGQGTIDFFQNRMLASQATSQGLHWENEYDLGWAANIKETFDVKGELWWLRWCLPAFTRKRGNGYQLRRRTHRPYAVDVDGF